MTEGFFLAAFADKVLSGLAVAFVIAVLRWAFAVDRSIALHTQVTKGLLERLEAHNALDEARFEALTKQIDSLTQARVDALAESRAAGYRAGKRRSSA